MRCDNCKVNEANINLQMRINQHVQELHLCSDCYKKIENQLRSPVGASPFGSDFGSFPFSGSFEEILNGFGIGAMGRGSQSMSGPQVESGGNRNGRGGLLDQFGRNLTALARAGKIDAIIGRDKEIARTIEILNRRNKNNPVLIGEPGVGKTAIAEGLALKITEGQVPAKLQGKQVYALDVSSLVANTGIRGQFEERMKQLIAELELEPDVILFIDEIHLLVGAGSAEGSMDAGNILKPALARGDIHVVGATTLKEYRVIEKDAALERRFQPVLVHEPSMEEAVRILNGIRPKYEEYHQVSYPDDVILACVSLSQRYIQDRYLPDKAIDLLDEAGSKVNLRADTNESANVQARLVQVVKQKEVATQHENYELAAKLRDEEVQLREMLQGANQNANHAATARPQVTVSDLQSIIEEKTGIPVQKLQESEQAKLKELAASLKRKVIGQDAAVTKVAKAIRRSRAGLKSGNRPIGSFLFVGPTGVGKTELAKCLAEELFGTRDSMIRLDMSEYMEKHTVSKLIGSPPGYVGYDEAGQLTEQVRRNPYSLILLDEIEKAHPDVQHIFLQIMEDGRLTDSQGRTVSFKDAVIIMTSNAGVTNRKITVGFGVDAGKSKGQNKDEIQNLERGRSKVQGQTRILLDTLGAFFRPEFLNRFDAIIEFNGLEESHMVNIVDIMLQELQENLRVQDIVLSVTDEAKQKLATLGYSTTFGARPLRRVLQDQVEDKIADLLLDGQKIGGIQVDLRDDSIIVAAK
jgi:ATP-dependent Clp protease ATP-binding subunit ClpE